VPFITLSGNLGLGGLKIVAGILSGSVGLTVDGFHSLADGIGTVFVLASLRIAGKPRDKSHPYGHGKVEFLASLVVFTVLVAIGILFFVESSIILMHGRREAPEMLGFLVAMISVVANYVMYNFNLCAGKKLNSPALMANGYENLTDLFSSFPVGIGIVAAQFGYTFCDPLAGVIVSIFIVANAGREWWHNLQNLLDHSASKATRNRIRSLAMAVNGVVGTGRLRTRLVGQNLWIDLDIYVSPHCTVNSARTIADEVRGSMLRKAKHVEDIMVYTFTGTGRNRPGVST
jgi:cation diffusion facilitator family transporter